MSDHPWIRWYLGDYLADTRRLSRDQHGAYTLILFDYYATEEAPPDDDSVLARISLSESVIDWRAIRSTLAGFFIIEDRGNGRRWYHKRVESEIARRKTEKAGRIQAARDTNLKRWGNSGSIGNRVAERIAETSLRARVPLPDPDPDPDPDSLQDPTSSGSSSPITDPKRKRTARGARKIPLPNNFGISDAVRSWATGRGFGDLEAHLESFKEKCEAHGYHYVNWDRAFMGAIRADWAEIRGRKFNGRGKTHLADEYPDRMIDPQTGRKYNPNAGLGGIRK